MPRSTTKTPAPNILTAEEVLAADDLPTETIEIPEWGGSVKVRSFTKAQQQEIRVKATKGNGEIDESRLEMLLVLHALIEPQFSEDQLAQLAEKSASAIDGILTTINSLAGAV